MAAKKGQISNPTGVGGWRKRGAAFLAVAALIRERTNDGAELVDFALEVMRGTKQVNAAQLHAAEWLSDRMMGKPIQAVELQARVEKSDSSTEKRLNVDALSPDELEAVYRSLGKMIGEEQLQAKLLSNEAANETGGELESELEGRSPAANKQWQVVSGSSRSSELEGELEGVSGADASSNGNAYTDDSYDDADADAELE